MKQMYWIKDVNWQSSDPETVIVRAHFAGDDVLEAVLADIRTMGHEVILSTTDYKGDPLDNRFCFDYGGMMCGSWKPFEWQIQDVQLGFYAHHLDQMYRMLHHALDNQDNKTFCRVYTTYWIFCTTREVIQEFLDAVKANEKEIRVQEQQEWDDYESALQAVNKDKIRVLPQKPRQFEEA